MEKNQMVSMLPNYILGTNISGYRKVTLELSDEEAQIDSETVTLGETDLTENVTGENETSQEEGENVTNQSLADENTTTNETSTTPSVSAEEKENYKKSAEIIKARLKSLEVEDYSISVDGSTGKIELTLPENDQTDTILSDIVQVGNFSISDTNTGEVLMTNKDIRSVTVEKSESYGYTVVVMNINFNTAGSRKFRNITKDYNENAVVEETSENTTNEQPTESVENTTDVQSTTTPDTENEDIESNTSEDSTNEESTEDATEAKAKTIDLKIDDTDMLSTGFSEVIDNGVLTLTLGTSADSEEIKNSLYGGYNIAAILENEPLPLTYQVSENVYIASTLDINDVTIMIATLAVIAVIISIFMIIKFKMKGLLSTILSTGFVALLLIIVRYTNVTMSLEGFLAVGLAFIINTIFNYMLFSNLKNKNLTKEERIAKYNESMKKYSLTLIPLLILSIVCCFTNWDTIYSFGMVTFWTILISLIYNLTITNLLVRNK